LKVKLEGQRPNLFGIGSTVKIYYDNKFYMQEQIPWCLLRLAEKKRKCMPHMQGDPKALHNINLKQGLKS